MAFDFSTLIQLGSYGFFVFIMFFGTKLQLVTMLATIAAKMKKLLVIRDHALLELRGHLLKHIGTLTLEQDAQLQTLINSIAIPPVSNLDPAGMVPKMENIFKTYDRYLKNGIRRIVDLPGMEPVSQSDLENMVNSLEVAIELNIFYKVVDHFYKLAKKGNVMMAMMLTMALPQLMEMAEALNAAAPHFQTGTPMGDGFGPMVARKFTGAESVDESTDKETSIFVSEFESRKIVIVKAKGPGGSVGNPGVVTQNIIRELRPSLVVTIDAGLRMESEKTGDVSEGVGVAMGGPGMDRYRIEEALAGNDVPVLTVVCKMTMKEAISAMPKDVLAQVEPTFARVLRMIQENSNVGEVVVVLGVGNSMGVA